MSRAVECDSCGALVLTADALTIMGVHIPGEKKDTVQTWDEIDICRQCVVLRSFREVITSACLELEKDFGLLPKTPDEQGG